MRQANWEARIKQGPVASVVGSVLGGLIGGGGTLAGIATTGGLIGSAIGSVVGMSLLGGGNKQQNPGTVAAPPQPGSVAMPETPTAQPGTGTSSPLTPEEIARGEAERQRRGRLSTILSQNNNPLTGEPTETLG